MPNVSATTLIIVILGVVVLILLFRLKLTAYITSKPTPPEAQRFARLLIAEIKLYNQQKIEAARTSGNIYQELKAEIERARKMYDERVGIDETNGRDYFHEELVRTIAGGDTTKLGRGYIERGT